MHCFCETTKLCFLGGTPGKKKEKTREGPQHPGGVTIQIQERKIYKLGVCSTFSLASREANAA